VISKSKILVVIPAFNEQATIAQVIDEVRQSLPAAHIAVINDGSGDGTGEEARRKDVFVLNHAVNLGIGSAVQTGLKFAQIKGYSIAVQVDGDGQHDPEDLPRLIAPIIQNGADLVIGSRFLGQSVFRSTFMRRMGILFFSFLNFFLTGKWITDPTSGFRAFSADAIRTFAANYPYDYPEPEVLVQSHRKALRLCEIPVTMKPRSAGASSISFLRAVYYMVKVPLSMILQVVR